MAEAAREHAAGGRKWSRRDVLAAGGALALGGALAGGARWWRLHENGQRADVVVAAAPGYAQNLQQIIADALRELGIDRATLRGKRVLLKPNLVETARGHQHINTHPSVVVAAAEAMRSLDAADVVVAEGQGHRRDSRIVLDESGMGAALREAGLRFVDLNHDDVAAVANAGGRTGLERLALPKTVLRADWVVSLPKLKTHHWAGLTCAMKNFFGVMPGVVYGWPKNVLHYRGIHESIFDINATVKPRLAIVDGVVGMEGDGPIMGAAREFGALIVGTNVAAVDATCARLIGIEPTRVEYLRFSAGRVGPIQAGNVAQRGEALDRFAQEFALLDLPHLQRLRR